MLTKLNMFGLEKVFQRFKSSVGRDLRSVSPGVLSDGGGVIFTNLLTVVLTFPSAVKLGNKPWYL